MSGGTSTFSSKMLNNVMFSSHYEASKPQRMPLRITGTSRTKKAVSVFCFSKVNDNNSDTKTTFWVITY